MSIFQEDLLEPVARTLRFHKGINEIYNNKKITLVDLGCGPKIRFYHYAKNKKIRFKKFIGIDPLIVKDVILTHKNNNEIQLINNPLATKIPLKTNSVDIVTGFAFLEHIDHPEAILLESIRIIRQGGRAIYTTPTPKAKNILEFLSYKMGLISKREINEHKNYFEKENLVKMLKRRGVALSNIKHDYFEFGLNNLLVVTK